MGNTFGLRFCTICLSSSIAAGWRRTSLMVTSPDQVAPEGRKLRLRTLEIGDSPSGTRRFKIRCDNDLPASCGATGKPRADAERRSGFRLLHHSAVATE